MPALIPSASVLLIEPTQELCAIFYLNFPAAHVEVCASFEDAVAYMPLNLYQVVVCPQRIASRDGYSLLSLNRLHNPCSPFIVTTERGEVADVKQAITHGALGFLSGIGTTPIIVGIIERLLSLYRLRFSIEVRTKWVTNYGNQLQTDSISETSAIWRGASQDNRVMCEQTLTAIEGSMEAFHAQANTLVSEARQRMWES